VDDGTGIVECMVKFPVNSEPPSIPALADTLRVTGKIYVRKRKDVEERTLDVERTGYSEVTPHLGKCGITDLTPQAHNMLQQNLDMRYRSQNCIRHATLNHSFLRTKPSASRHEPRE